MGCISAGLIRVKFIISAAEKLNTEMHFPQRWWSTISRAWCGWCFPCSDGSGSRTGGRLVEGRRGIYPKTSIFCVELRFPGVEAEAGVCQELLAGTADKVLEWWISALEWPRWELLAEMLGPFVWFTFPFFPGRTWGSQDLFWNAPVWMDSGWRNPCVVLHLQCAHELRANKRAGTGHCWQRTWDKYCNQNCLAISPFSPPLFFFPLDEVKSQWMSEFSVPNCEGALTC